MIFFINDKLFYPWIHLLDYNYFRYIDNILLIYSPKNDFTKITDRWSNIELSVDFTYEQDNNNTLPFSDILLINIDKLELKFHQ